MLVSGAINAANELRAGNRIAESTKRRWLLSLDKRIYEEIILVHEGSENVSEPDDYTSKDSTLLLPDTYSDVYVWYLVSQIDLALAETERYYNSSGRFNSLYSAFERRYTREHMPLQKHRLHNVMRVRGVK